MRCAALTLAVLLCFAAETVVAESLTNITAHLETCYILLSEPNPDTYFKSLQKTLDNQVQMPGDFEDLSYFKNKYKAIADLTDATSIEVAENCKEVNTWVVDKLALVTPGGSGFTHGPMHAISALAALAALTHIASNYA